MVPASFTHILILSNAWAHACTHTHTHLIFPGLCGWSSVVLLRWCNHHGWLGVTQGTALWMNGGGRGYPSMCFQIDLLLEVACVCRDCWTLSNHVFVAVKNCCVGCLHLWVLFNARCEVMPSLWQFFFLSFFLLCGRWFRLVTAGVTLVKVSFKLLFSFFSVCVYVCVCVFLVWSCTFCDIDKQLHLQTDLH